jgi:hypothetical protein
MNTNIFTIRVYSCSFVVPSFNLIFRVAPLGAYINGIGGTGIFQGGDQAFRR